MIESLIAFAVMIAIAGFFGLRAANRLQNLKEKRLTTRNKNNLSKTNITIWRLAEPYEALDLMNLIEVFYCCNKHRWEKRVPSSNCDVTCCTVKVICTKCNLGAKCMAPSEPHDPVCPRCTRRCCPAAHDWGNSCELDEYFHRKWLASRNLK